MNFCLRGYDTSASLTSILLWSIKCRRRRIYWKYETIKTPTIDIKHDLYKSSIQSIMIITRWLFRQLILEKKIMMNKSRKNIPLDRVQRW